MNLKIILIFFFTLSCLSLNAKPTLYGKLWIAVESEDTVSGTDIDVVSNNSRLGAKGSLEFGKSLEVIYQAEFEVDPIDGKADESKEKTFKQRNTFVGIKGSYGTLFLGTHDTALKESQDKIDLFDDLAGDIKNILQGENRMKDFVGYTTPTFGGVMSATFNVVKGVEILGNDSIEDSTSISLNYKTKSFYAAIAIDSKLEGYDSTRLTLHMPWDKTQLGIIYQDTKKLSTGVKEDGYVISLSYKVGKKGLIKVQIAESDMKLSSGKQTSVGYDYKLTKKARAFFFFTDLLGSVESKEKEVAAVGFEYKF